MLRRLRAYARARALTPLRDAVHLPPMLRPILIPALLLAAGARRAPRPDGLLRPPRRGGRTAPCCATSSSARSRCGSPSRRCSRSAPRCRSRRAIAPASRPRSPPADSTPSRTGSRHRSRHPAHRVAAPGARRPVTRTLRWRAGVGGMLYWPSEDQRHLPSGRTDPLSRRRRRGLSAAGAGELGPDGLGPLRLPPLHHRRAGAPGILPGAGREPGVTLGRPGPRCPMMSLPRRLVLAASRPHGARLRRHRLAACEPMSTSGGWRRRPCPGPGSTRSASTGARTDLPVRIWVEDAEDLPGTWRARSTSGRAFPLRRVRRHDGERLGRRRCPRPGRRAAHPRPRRSGCARWLRNAPGQPTWTSMSNRQIRLPIRIFVVRLVPGNPGLDPVWR